MVSPSRARALQFALRNARLASGHSLEKTAKALGWHTSRLHRIETGEKVPDEEETAQILTALGVGADELARVVELAKPSPAQHWVVDLPDLPRKFSELADFEADATEITEVAVTTVPGLLQLPEYARALFRKAGVPARDIGKLMEFRLLRQEVLRRDTPLALRALLDESVLSRPYGGSAVMARQLRHLLAMTELVNVTIQVIPYDAAHTPVDGNYRILYFANVPPLPYVEYPTGGLFLEQPSLVQGLEEFTSLVEQAALSPEQSYQVIAESIRKWEFS